MWSTLISFVHCNEFCGFYFLHILHLYAKIHSVLRINTVDTENWATPSSLLVKGYLRSKKV